MYRLAALALLAACGDNLAGFDLADLGSALETAHCERLVRCGVLPTVDECIAVTRAPLQTDLLAAVDAETVTFRDNRIDECLAAISAASCVETDETVREMAACLALFEGSRQPDQSCQLDEQCTSLRCVKTDCRPGQCCEGTCAPVRKQLDAACNATPDCDRGLHCAPDSTCKPLAAPGAACRDDRDCAYGSGCIGAGVEPGTCRELPLIGERCLYQRCAEVGARCRGGTCESNGVGAACSSDVDCGDLTLCNLVSSTCERLPLLDEECATVCGGESFCNQTVTPARCTAPLEDGTPCRSGDQCLSTYCYEGEFFDACAPRPTCI